MCVCVCVCVAERERERGMKEGYLAENRNRRDSSFSNSYRTQFVYFSYPT